MLTIKSQVRINAPAEEVWMVVTCMQFYSDWNSQLSLLDGRVEVGERIKIKFKPLYHQSFTLTPRIHRHEVLQTFGWKGITMLPLIFDGEFIFDLEKLDDNTTMLRYTQHYSGLLAFVLPRFNIFKDARKSCIKMNAEIKRRVEEVFARQTLATA